MREQGRRELTDAYALGDSSKELFSIEHARLGVKKNMKKSRHYAERTKTIVLEEGRALEEAGELKIMNAPANHE